MVFLRSLLPGKPIDEIYTVLGRAKQGKTERYRTFFHHFAAQPDELLIHPRSAAALIERPDAELPARLQQALSIGWQMPWGCLSG
mgnify:CR=1 FL=1